VEQIDPQIRAMATRYYPPYGHSPSAVVLLLVFVIVPLEAQQLDSGTVNVTVREAMGMVDGFLIRSETRRAKSDQRALVRLRSVGQIYAGPLYRTAASPTISLMRFRR
jgi:hypothetical protein